ncbi:hypothetical protein V6N11_073220 [Hibiscus sabdariffa]|uniref:RNase H type-1 domain-containing protein n=1 Tax=Hibiscus sabdariffa TaxID=183260 RepID=A0ABR2A5D0_9ROSI
MSRTVNFLALFTKEEVYAALHSMSPLKAWSEISPIIRDIKEMVVFFRGCRFTFTGRESNSPAHELAAEGLRHNSDCFWIEETPPLVDLLAAKDRRNQEPP